VLGARRNEDGRAGFDLALLAGDGHQAAAADEDVHLLALGVSVEALFAAGFSTNPGHGELLGVQLGREE
jgi:hypothetical protein